jgi:hypothetical protein
VTTVIAVPSVALVVPALVIVRVTVCVELVEPTAVAGAICACIPRLQIPVASRHFIPALAHLPKLGTMVLIPGNDSEGLEKDEGKKETGKHQWIETTEQTSGWNVFYVRDTLRPKSFSRGPWEGETKLRLHYDPTMLKARMR